MKNKPQKDNLVIYQGENGDIELRADIEKDTIWATQADIVALFDVDVRTVSEHLQNIFKSEELQETSVIRKFRNTGTDGKKYMTNFYNLDAIIAVGYRVNSKMATQFRIWATRVLHEYLINGYALNRYRLDEAPEVLVGLHDAITMLESDDKPGRLKGKIVIRLTKDLLPNTNK
jgi:hypothetical protein